MLVVILPSKFFSGLAFLRKHSKVERSCAFQDFLPPSRIHNCPLTAQHAGHTREQHKELSHPFLDAATRKILKHTVSVPLHRLVDAFANPERFTSDLRRKGRNNAACCNII